MNKKHTLMARREYRTKLGCSVVEVLQLNTDTGTVELAITLASERMPKPIALVK